MKLRQEVAFVAFVCFTMGQVQANSSPRHEKRPHSVPREDRKIDEVPGFGTTRQGLESVSECLIKFSFLRCTQAFLLSRMDRQRRLPDTGHIGRDFVNSLYNGDSEGRGIEGNLLESFNAYENLTDQSINKRLRENLQRFFRDRNIKLHVLPGMLVKVVPSRDDSLKFAYKKGSKPRNHHTGRSRAAGSTKESDVDLDEHTNTKFSDSDSESLGKRKNKKPMLSHKTTILQMAVPVMIMPVILAWTALPFLLPVLKMATFMSIMMNNFAFISALIMAARTYAAQDNPEPVNYAHHYR